MRNWLISDGGDRWSVKLDVMDLGGHLDATYRSWGCTLAARVREVLRVVWLVSALPLDYECKLRILRTKFIPAALHGVEASLLSQSGYLRLRAAFVRACWSSKMSMSHSGTVLSLLDGPEGVDPGFCIVWFRFRLMRRYLAYRPDESGHGPVHLLVRSAARIGFKWCSEGFCWDRPGLPRLPFLEGPIQHFKSAIVDAWKNSVAADFCSRKGFWCGPFLDFEGSMQLLVSSHVRSRDKALLRGILSGDVWNGFLLSQAGGRNIPCRFCGGVDGDGHLFWDCTFPPLVHIRESPEFSGVVNLDKSNWPRCLLWHGWLPALSGSTFGSPRAEDATRIAKNRLEAALGSYVAAYRHPFDDFRLGGRDFDVGDSPFVWSDGSLVVDKVSGVGVAGAGVYAHISGASWFHRRWAHLDLLPPLIDGGGERCWMYCSVPGPLQTVQRAEIWRVLVALQGQIALHVGVDNLNVVNHLSSLISGRWSGRPFPLINDGDLLGLAREILHSRGRGTTLVSKVKGHADEGLVDLCRVREVDRFGNNEADAADGAFMTPLLML